MLFIISWWHESGICSDHSTTSWFHPSSTISVNRIEFANLGHLLSFFGGKKNVLHLDFPLEVRMKGYDQWVMTLIYPIYYDHNYNPVILTIDLNFQQNILAFLGLEWKTLDSMVKFSSKFLAFNGTGMDGSSNKVMKEHFGR